MINDRTLSCIIDMADANGDDAIGVVELAQMLECDDVLALTALVTDKRKL